MPDDNLRINERQPWCLSHQQMIEDLRHEVFGNGKPGLKADMQDLKTTLRVSLWWLRAIAAIAAAPVAWQILTAVSHVIVAP